MKRIKWEPANNAILFPRWVFILVFLWFANSCCCVAQQSANYTITHYTNENGLNQNTISDMALDTNNFLWLGTQGGIARYDGARFRHYNSTNSKLAADRIRRVAVTKDGSLYAQVSSHNQLVYKLSSNYSLEYDSILNQHQFVYFEPTDAPVEIGKKLESLGNDEFSKKIRERLFQFYVKEVRTFVSDHECYLSFNDKIELVNFRNRTIKECASLPLYYNMVLVGKTLLAFDGRLRCIAIRDGEILKEIPGSPAFKSLILKLEGGKMTDFSAYRNNNGPNLLFNIRGDIWLVKEKNGLIDASLRFSNTAFTTATSSILYDEPKGVLYIGTLVNGLYILRESPFAGRLFDTVDMVKNVTYAQLAIAGGMVTNWYFKYNPTDAKTHLLKEQLQPTALFRSENGQVWYSTEQDIVRCDSFMNPLIKYPLPKRIGSNRVVCFMEDSNHQVWFAADNSLGYIQENKANYVIDHDPYFWLNNISVIFNFSDEVVWIGHEGGLLTYNKKTGKLDSTIRLPGINIRSIYKAKDGSIWLGSYGRGFYKYINGRFVKMPVDANKFLLFVHSFTEDHNGYLWMPTNNGLFQCRKAALDSYAANPKSNVIYYYYYRHTGKYTNEFNGGWNPKKVYYRDSLLLLPTIKGIVAFVPDQMRPNLPGNKILVENIQVDGKEQVLNKDILLPPNFKYLEFTISAPFIGEESNNVLEYSLGSTEEDWYPITGGRIIYNRLPHGDYQLHIRRRTGFGDNDYAMHTVLFTVRPHWYQTNLFYILLTLGLGGVVYGFIRIRLATSNKARQLLETVVSQRTSELKETVAALNVSQTNLNEINGIQEQAINVILHDVQSPINYMAISARYFKKRAGQMKPEEITAYSGALVESAVQLNEFINDLVQWLILRQSKQTNDWHPVNLNNLFAEVARLYTEMIKFNGNTLEIIVDRELTVLSNKNNLKLIIRNLLDNANKNCRNGKIVIQAFYDISVLATRITVKDTGNGMPETEKRRLLNSYDQADLGIFQAGKIGFMLVYHFLKKLGGRLDIESEQGVGTTVHILLPENKELIMSGSGKAQ